MLLGIVFTSVGAYGLAGGTGARFYINEREVSPQEFGQIASTVGIIVLLGGIGMAYIGFKPSRRIIPPTVFTISLLCYLIAVREVLQNGSLVGGIAAVVFGCSFLVTLFYWVRKG